MKFIKSLFVSLGFVIAAPVALSQSNIVIKITPYEKLPAVPYTEKSPQQIELEKVTRTMVPIYNANHLNYYATQLYPLPLYGGWNVRPIHRYGCRTGDIVLVNKKGVEVTFPIKTDRESKEARKWDSLNGLECPFEASPKMLNSWIVNSKYVVFETSDPGYVAFDFINGKFVKNLVLKTRNLTIKSGLDGSVSFYSPEVTTVEQNRYFVDEENRVLKAPINQEIHRYAFAYREMYMCQESLSWGEPCPHREQLKELFSRKVEK